MEAFFRTHKYLVEHTAAPVHRTLMDEIDWNQRLIGIKGSRGVGKTTFLLEYAKRNFGTDRSCLYINLNNFYFTERTLIDFADEFRKKGGKTLLIDQIFKYPEWSKELRYCYDHFPDLKIVFTGSAVMRLKEENPDLKGCVASYILRGFSFREFVNLKAGTSFPPVLLNDMIDNHKEIAAEVTDQIDPFDYFQDYLHHGYYPFFLEKRNYSENLVKTINMTLEIDILLLKQIELRYLPKIRKLLYLLASNVPNAPNVSQLSVDIQTSRATVMNYIKYLQDARLLNILYPVNESFPKKPDKIYLQNTNLMYAFWPVKVDEQVLRETFFYNTVNRAYHINKGEKNAHFLVDEQFNFRIQNNGDRVKFNTGYYYAIDMIDKGNGREIPLWLFGFLY